MQPVYERVTQRIVEALEQGTIPWRRTWSRAGGLPRNLVSGREYRGVNLLLLALSGYEQPLFLTFKQAQDWGGHVRKGEHGIPIVFWNWWDREDASTGETERIPFLKSFTVFNVEQCELDSRLIPILAAQHVRDFQPIGACERVLADMPQRPAIHEGEGGAFYRPSTDSVHLPARSRFESDEAFYAVAFHELAHATGHASRLNREGITDVAPFGTPIYSREELVAELCSAFVCGHTGIDSPAVEANAAAYLDGWLKVLRSDSKLVISAAAQAQRAADFILNVKHDSKRDDD